MEKSYYLVEKKGDKSRAFMVGLENRLKHIAGDKSITKMMEFKEGNLTTTPEYNIHYLNEIQFDIYKERYLSKLKKENN